MENTGFVYIWRDRKHNRYYIGCHWGFEDDGYVCSSRWMKSAYKRRPEDFKRKILKSEISSKKMMIEEETKWLSLIQPDEIKTKYYNLVTHQWHWSGKDNSLTVREKISKTQQGRTLTEEHKANIKKSMKGVIQRRVWTKEQKTAKSVEQTGRKRTVEHIENLKDSLKGLKRKIVECTHCGQLGGANGMSRWHFDNCKLKGNE
jgi:hypothetical protein